MFGPPAAAGYCIFYLSFFVSPSPQASLRFSPEQSFWLTNAAWFLGEWLVFLLAEPLLVFAGYLVRRRLDRTAHPHPPE